MTWIDTDCLPKDPEHERTEQRLAEAINRVRELEGQVQELEYRCGVLSNQLRGGNRDVDPRTCEEHPGNVLIQLGWQYLPDEPGEPDDEIGAYWHDPNDVKRTGQHSVMALPLALSIACRRLAGLRVGKGGRPRSWLERMVEDDDG